MATREEKIKLDVTGADQSARDLEKVGGTAKRVGDAVEEMGRDADKASKKVDDLGDEAKQTGGQLSKLEREVLQAKIALKALGDELERTSDKKIAVEFDKQSAALAKMEQRARSIAKLRKDLAPKDTGGPAKVVDLGGTDRRGGIIRNTLGDLFSLGGQAASGVGGKLSGALSDLGPGATIKALLGASAAVPAGAAAGGALLAGGALAGVGAGVAGAVAGNPAKFKAEWNNAIASVVSRWKIASTDEFSGPLSSSIKIIQRELDDIDVEKPLAKASKYLEPLAQGGAGFLGPFVKGLDALIDKAGPVIGVLEKDLPLLGKAFEQAFGDAGEGADGAAKALDDVIQFVGAAVIAVGKFVKVSSELYDWAQKTIPLMESNKETTLSYGRALDGATSSNRAYVDTEKLLADAATAATDALRKQFGILLSTEEATDRATVATKDLTESFRENGYTIDGNSEKALKNREQIRQTIQAWEDEADAAMAAGNNTKESIDAANRKLLQHLEDLRATLRAHGQNTAAVDAYIDKLKEAMKIKLSDQSVVIHIRYDDKGLPKNLGSRYGGTDQYASGGDVRNTGVALVGESGPELVFMNRGDHVLNASDTARVRATSAAPSYGGGGGGRGMQLPPTSVLEQALAAVVLKLMQDGHLPVPSTAVSG